MFIGKFAIRSERPGILPIKFYFLSDAYTGLDVFLNADVMVVEATPEQLVSDGIITE